MTAIAVAWAVRAGLPALFKMGTATMPPPPPKIPLSAPTAAPPKRYFAKDLFITSHRGPFAHTFGPLFMQSLCQTQKNFSFFYGFHAKVLARNPNLY